MQNNCRKRINKEKLYDLISSSQTDTVIAAISGSSGLELIHHSIKSGKKVLIAKIAEARIDELSEKFYLKNINLKKLLHETDVIFLEISDQQHLSCFHQAYEKSFAFKNKYKVKIIKKPEIEQIVYKADNIVQFGWKKEAIPVSKPKKTLISRIFQEIFN